MRMAAPAAETRPLPAPLDGVRVLHVPHLLTLGAGRLLANLGADVVLLEPPRGAASRSTPPFLHHDPSPEASLPFLFATTSQRSITLDLDQPDAQPLLHRLLPTCQIVLTGGSLAELNALKAAGLDPDSALAAWPQLVWVRVTGFGLDGPHAEWLCPDIVGLAMSGVMTLAGYLDRAPYTPPWGQGFLAAGMRAAEGALLALRVAEATGEGQTVEVSMQEALSMAQETAMQYWDMRREVRKRGGGITLLPGIGTYACADGYVYTMVGIPGFGAPWPVLLDWMKEEGKAEDLVDPSWLEVLTSMNMRTLTAMASQPELIAEMKPRFDHINEVLSRFFAGHDKTYLYEEGQKRRLLVGPVNSPKDLLENRQLNARDWYTSVMHPELDEAVVYPGPPFRLPKSPWRISARPPLIGEHNVDLWRDELGLSQQQLEALAGAGII
jgi:benzylsuccinate CoA-transferase BbsE subunit